MALLESVSGSTTVGVSTNSASPKAASPSELPFSSAAAEASLSSSSDVFGAVDSFFNLSAGSERLSGYYKLSPSDKEAFMKIVSKLAAEGFMGYEVYEDKNGVKRKEDITLSIADSAEERRKRRYLTGEEAQSS